MIVTNVEERIKLQCDRIGAEVLRAMELHRGMNSLHEAYAVIMEEVEEFWDEVKMNPNKLDHDEKKRIARMQTELLHIAAMCIRTTIDCDLMGG